MITRSSMLAVLLSSMAVLPASQDAVDMELLRSYFGVCDSDGSGWMSYREGRESLALDRPAYQKFDVNEDGRVDLEEFSANYVEVTRRVGVLPTPRSATEQPVDLPRLPTQILTAYDADSDGALQLSELIKLLSDYGREDLPSEIAMTNLDTNGDGGLNGAELERASRLLASLTAAGRPTVSTEPPPKSIDELFGRSVERPASIDTSRQPPLIVGPVLPFRRLNLDAKGGISMEDLYGLLSPATMKPSVGAIHASLDLDENGVIDRKELATALGMQGR
jgi:Ca2+-binding EF-hand superfamily protein